MAREGLEVADVFRHFGPAFLDQHGASLSSERRRAMSAIESCRTAALGGHVEQCGDCGHQRVWYNSCRNRNCPKCQALARAQWLDDRQAELLDVPYFHVVFTVPREIEVLAFQNQTVVYDILFQGGIGDIAQDRRRPKASGGGDRLPGRAAHLGTELVAPPARSFSCPGRRNCTGRRQLDRLPPEVLPAGQGAVANVPGVVPALPGEGVCRWQAELLHPLPPPSRTRRVPALPGTGSWNAKWVVYAKRPFAGPAQVLDYVGRYTHRVAISNNRLVSMDNGKVSFRWKDYRDGNRQKTMTLDGKEFVRRFLIHVLPDGFHRIRYYGFLGNCHRARKLALCRELLGMAPPVPAADPPAELPRSL